MYNMSKANDTVLDHLAPVQPDQIPSQTRVDSSTSPAIAPPSDQLTRWLALGGVVGPILFVAAFLVGGVLRPGYSPIHQAVSDLGVGSNPWLLNVPLILLGVLLSAFSLSFFRSFRSTLTRTWCWACALLLACTGLGFADAGIFTEAPATVALHWMIGMPLLALGSVLGFLLTGLAPRQDPQWHRWSVYSLVAGISTLVLIAFMFWVWTPGTPLASLKLGGLMERVLFIEILAWYVALGWRLFRGTPTLAGRSSGTD